MTHLTEYLGLFGAAFLSATIFPFQSEAVLFAMLGLFSGNFILLIIAFSLLPPAIHVLKERLHKRTA